MPDTKNAKNNHNFVPIVTGPYQVTNKVCCTLCGLITEGPITSPCVGQHEKKGKDE